MEEKRTPWNKGKKNTIKYIYYTDGIKNLRVPEGTECPEGFHRGRIKRQNTAEEIALAQEKKKQTCIKKYGVEHPFQAESVKGKIKQTVQERYGVDYVTQATKMKEATIKTSLERYGTTSPVQTKECKEKRKQTCIDKYGVDNCAKLKTLKEKARQTCIKKYGVDNYSKTQEMHQLMINIQDERLAKITATKRLNNTFDTSSPEENYYNFLVEQYGADNVIRQYSDERYPFVCDFYIPSKDLFIELNLSWTHGGKPFENTEADLLKLAIWQEKAKTSQYYKNAIDTWTIRDVKKLNTARDNKLNYKVFYTEEEIYNDR